MKKQKSMLILVFALGLLSNSCENDKLSKWDERAEFINSSERAVYVSFDNLYPDTSLYDPNPALSPETNKVLAGGTSKSVLRLHGNWEGYFNSHIPSDTLMIFVYDAEVLETTPWDTVKANYLVLKRYDLSLQDLENMSWTITYP